MHHKLKTTNKVLEANIQVNLLIIKNTSVSVRPYRPASHYECFLEANQIVSSFGFHQHKHQIKISIPLNIKLPPEITAEITVKEKVSIILKTTIRAENAIIRFNDEILSCQQFPCVQPIL